MGSAPGDEVLRIFVGASTRQEVPARVLKSSIERRASIPVEVRSMAGLEAGIPRPAARRNRPRTPFSFQRFLIPGLCGFAGRAVYLDSDMVVLGDVRELAEAIMPEGANVLTTDAQLSVLVLDCARLAWDPVKIVRALDRGELAYEDLMQRFAGIAELAMGLPARWNCLDGRPYDAALVHFTDMIRQPWLAPGHALEPLWLEELGAALERDGGLLAAALEAERWGHIREGLVERAQGMGRR